MRSLVLLCTIIMLVPATTVFAGADVEIGDLILNRTMTKVGHDFYRIFSSAWVPPPDTASHNINIVEKANARWGSIISIFVDNRLVWRKILGMRSSDVEETATDAVRQVQMIVLRTTIMEQQYQSEDMASDGY